MHCRGESVPVRKLHVDMVPSRSSSFGSLFSLSLIPVHSSSRSFLLFFSFSVTFSLFSFCSFFCALPLRVPLLLPLGLHVFWQCNGLSKISFKCNRIAKIAGSESCRRCYTGLYVSVVAALIAVVCCPRVLSSRCSKVYIPMTKGLSQEMRNNWGKYFIRLSQPE